MPLLPAASRGRLRLAREFLLPRGRLRRAAAQLAYLLPALLPTRSPAAAHLLQTALSLPRAFERALALRDGLVRVALRSRLRALQVVGGLVELTAQLLHARVAPLARKALKLARGLARLIGHLLLLALASAAVLRLTLLSPPLLFERAFLSAREFFEAALGLGLGLLCALTLLAVDGLVLVLHLRQFEFHQVGQLLRLALAAAAAAALLPHRDLHLAEDGVGREQALQGALLGRQGVASQLLAQVRRRALHLARGRAQVFGHPRQLLAPFKLFAHAPPQALDELQRVCLQLLLPRGDRLVAVAAFLRRVALPLAHQAVRRGDQLLLPPRQGVLILVAALALLAAALLLRLLVPHLEGLDFDEVDVARRLVRRVARLRVIGDEVAGLELVLLHEEGVRARQAPRRVAAQLLQVDALLCAAVD